MMRRSSRLQIIVERVDARGRVRREAVIEDARGLPSYHSTLVDLREVIRTMHFVLCQLSVHARTPPCITQILAEDGADLVVTPDAYDRLPSTSLLRVRVMVHTPLAHAWNFVRPLRHVACC
jgi:hypothetical protein